MRNKGLGGPFHSAQRASRPDDSELTLYTRAHCLGDERGYSPQNGASDRFVPRLHDGLHSLQASPLCCCWGFPASLPGAPCWALVRYEPTGYCTGHMSYTRLELPCPFNPCRSEDQVRLFLRLSPRSKRIAKTTLLTGWLALLLSPPRIFSPIVGKDAAELIFPPC
jgi:hypothetical protein